VSEVVAVAFFDIWCSKHFGNDEPKLLGIWVCEPSHQRNTRSEQLSLSQ